MNQDASLRSIVPFVLKVRLLLVVTLENLNT